MLLFVFQLLPARYKLQILRILRRFTLRTAWDCRSFDAPKIVAVQSPYNHPRKIIEGSENQRRVAKKKSCEAAVITNVAYPIDDDPCSWRAGKSAPVISVCTDQKMIRATIQNASIWMVVDAPGRETTCECLVTYERNAECYFRSRGAFIARSFLRSLEHKSRFTPRNCLMRKTLSYI